MRIPFPVIPKEHGAWAVLFVPMAVGASVTGEFNANIVYLGLSALGGFLSYVPAQTILRHWFIAPQGREKLQTAIFWAAVYLGTGICFAVPLLIQRLGLLWAIGLTAALAFFGNFILVRRHAKKFLSDVVSVLGLTLSAPSAYYVTSGKLDQTAALLWLLHFLFFAASILYVHMKLRIATIKKPGLSFAGKLRLGKMTLIFHFIVLSAVSSLALMNFTPWLVPAAFVPMTIHALYGTFKFSHTVRFKKLGMVLLAHALVFALLCAIGIALFSAEDGRSQSSLPASSQPLLEEAGTGVDLQGLINAARRGDSIFVPAGFYEGNLVIDKQLALIGRERPVIRGSGNGSVVVIAADSCTFKGFVVEHCGKLLVNEDSGILVKSHGNVVEGNRLRDVLFGIYLWQANDNVVVDNHIVGREELELGERGSGIHIWNSQRNRFIGNAITGSRDGFYIQNAHHTYLERNEAFGLRYGVHYMYADSNVFLQNTFHDNIAGAAIMYSRGIVLRHNSFVRNRGFASFGILFQDCHNSIADSNVIADNVIGMFFEASTNNYFRHNIIAQNDLALQMFQNSERNTFMENNFIDNLNALSLIGKRTLSHWQENGRGNYWSAYDGYDLDDDGIGDFPMKLQNAFDYLEGQHPNLRLYLYSPAAQALATAAKAFPIIELNNEADPYPLMQPVDLQRITPKVDNL